MPTTISEPWLSFLRDVGRALGQPVEVRFEKELRPYLLNEDRETATLRLWLDEFFDE